MGARFSDRRRNRRGMVVIMLSLMVAVVLLPLVGLAIDGAILYLIQAKLSAAVDAATLAAARSLSVGLDLSSQTASATATAQSFSPPISRPGTGTQATCRSARPWRKPHIRHGR